MRQSVTPNGRRDRRGHLTCSGPLEQRRLNALSARRMGGITPQVGNWAARRPGETRRLRDRWRRTRFRRSGDRVSWRQGDLNQNRQMGQ